MVKKISLKTLKELGVKNPNAWHHLMAAGKMERDMSALVIDDALEKKILNGEILPEFRPKNPRRTSEEISRLQAICLACPWNVNWICEHSGCRPCRQRRAGGLKGLILDHTTHCPAGKWQ